LAPNGETDAKSRCATRDHRRRAWFAGAAAHRGAARQCGEIIAAGVLNAIRQTGSVLGVALFGSLIGQPDTFMRGAHQALAISFFCW
jgi:hypothetical protein